MTAVAGSNNISAATSRPRDIDNEHAEGTYERSPSRDQTPFISLPISWSAALAESPVVENERDDMISDGRGYLSLRSTSNELQTPSQLPSYVSVPPAVAISKGKYPSSPIPIQQTRPPRSTDDMDDVFSHSPDEAQPSRPVSPHFSQTIPTGPMDGTPGPSSASPSLSSPGPSSPVDIIAPGKSKGKGKARAVDPPTLPPLSFTPMEVGYGRYDWPSPGSPTMAGPSSLTSVMATSPPSPPPPPASPQSLNVDSANSVPGTRTPTENASAAGPRSAGSTIRLKPNRTQSLSGLSIRSTSSIATKLKVKLVRSPRRPSLLAKRLLSRKGATQDTPAATSLVQTAEAVALAQPASSSQGAFRMSLENLISAPSLPPPPPPSPPPVFDLEVGPVILPPSPFPRTGGAGDSYFLPKHNQRSYSSPYPLTNSILNIVSDESATYTFQPVNVSPPSYWERLPREVQVRVLMALVGLHESDFEDMVKSSRWTALRSVSSKYRWMGKQKAVRELVKISRVSKAWMSLAFDGQLWAKLDMSSFTHIPHDSVLRLARFSGSFVQSLNLAGHAHLSLDTFQSLTNHLCLTSDGFSGLHNTQLTSLTLRGCTALTTRALHYLLVRSPSLRRLDLRGLSAANNTTCDVLSVYCPHLLSLDIGRCPNVDGAGLRALMASALNRGDALPLRELRASGCDFITSDLLRVLARAAPALEVLDLSYARGLSNSCLKAFVSCSDADVADPHFSKVRLTAREAGLDPADTTRYWRRVTRLRHVNFSFCPALTDSACRHLAHAVPQLEFLELAGIGPGLHDEGLIHLLGTTPRLRRLDLEDANALSNAVLGALTPAVPSVRRGADGPQTGDALEHLVVSHATEVTDDALVALIERCTRLRVLEADNTRMSGRALQTFVRRARERRLRDARVVAGDNRGVGESAVRELAHLTRPRLGWRGYDARKLGYLDAADGEALEDVGQDELDPLRVVVKTFYSWQTVDAVRAARKRRVRARRIASYDDDEGSRERGEHRSRWWSPGSRRAQTYTPTVLDARDGGAEACVIM